MAVPDELRHAERPPGIAGRRLYPDPLERTLAQQAPVADAVQGDSARQREILLARETVRRARHAQHDLFADAVDGEDGRFVERRGEKSTRRMGLVMLGVQQRSLIVAERLAELPILIELLLHPERSRAQEGGEAAGGDREIGLENALELQERLVIEADICDVPAGDAALAKAIVDGVSRE